MSNIHSILQDLVSFAVPLGFNTIRVTTDTNNTLFEAVREDNKIFMKATSKYPINEFSGQFGLPNLKVLKGYVETFGKLQTIDDSGKTNLKLEIQKNNSKDATLPTDILFALPKSNVALYRLQRDNLPPQPVMKAAIKWDAEIVEPSRTKIAEFNSFAGILSDIEKSFSIKTDTDQNLNFYIGDEDSSNSRVTLTFSENVSNNVEPKLYWTCSDFLNVMNLASAAQTIVKFSNQGIIEIVANTGMLEYSFILPGNR